MQDDHGIVQATIGDIIIVTADQRNNTLGTMSSETIVPKSEYLLTIQIDQEYLKSVKTTYPIRIDPTIEVTYNGNGSGAIQDVTINSLAGSEGTSGSVFVGKRPSYEISRTLMRFPGLNLNPLHAQEITSAYVEIKDLLCESENLTVYCYQFTGNNWSESTANWSNVNPESYSRCLSSNNISYDNGVNQTVKHCYQFDILAAVRDWATYAGSQEKGILFKASYAVESGSTNIHKTFASYNRSSNQPHLTLTYASRSTSAWGTIMARGGVITGSNRHITFSPETSGTFYIETAQYNGAPSRDTKIYLYRGSTLLASNDDYSGNYSRIEYNLTAGTTYTVCVTEIANKITDMNCYLMVCRSESLVSSNSAYYNLMKNFNRIGNDTKQYNCLSYALGITSTWTWPWLYDSPTLPQVTSYMNSLGYARVDSYTLNCIVAYGPSAAEITHFSLVTSGTTRAKCGQLELMRHESYDPYFSNSPYGSPQAYAGCRYSCIYGEFACL